jgi:AcrR family transcriptional regulator
MVPTASGADGIILKARSYSRSGMNNALRRTDTKQRILDSAERLFADNGFGGTSLRSIIGDAKVNLAAIHYHYHSKEALVDAVILRHLEPINRQRIELLDAAELQAGPESPSFEAVIEAFVAPALRVTPEQPNSDTFARLLGRILASDKSLFSQSNEKVADVLGRFMHALQNASAGLPRAELLWRMQFMSGALALTLLRGQNLVVMSHGLCDPSYVEDTIRRLVAFTAAGFRAPVPMVPSRGIHV